MNEDTIQTPNTGTPPDKTAETGAKLFTQAELETHIRERLERERKKYADYEQLKDAAGKWAEHEEAQKSTLDKLNEQLQALKAQAEAAAQERDMLRIRQAAMTAIAAKGIPVERLDAAWKLMGAGALKLAEDGSVAGLAEAVEGLIRANPFLLPVPGAPKVPAGDSGGDKDAEAVRAQQLLDSINGRVASRPRFVQLKQPGE